MTQTVRLRSLFPPSITGCLDNPPSWMNPACRSLRLRSRVNAASPEPFSSLPQPTHSTECSQSGANESQSGRIYQRHDQSNIWDESEAKWDNLGQKWDSLGQNGTMWYMVDQKLTVDFTVRDKDSAGPGRPERKAKGEDPVCLRLTPHPHPNLPLPRSPLTRPALCERTHRVVKANRPSLS